ncbi:hypothetical protein C8F04DRAFT_263040 [Mycena alexandri]|uniref:Uncharacterized protein n=1 Tax=Mycena alexandri TaxID=1745969 RepID=A0AAD6S7A7_9AGAR|nr:hypothetical protein C8F04DRAFT_263040 [Mycena alexandri]
MWSRGPHARRLGRSGLQDRYQLEVFRGNVDFCMHDTDSPASLSRCVGLRRLRHGGSSCSENSFTTLTRDSRRGVGLLPRHTRHFLCRSQHYPDLYDYRSSSPFGLVKSPRDQLTLRASPYFFVTIPTLQLPRSPHPLPIYLGHLHPRGVASMARDSSLTALPLPDPAKSLTPAPRRHLKALGLTLRHAGSSKVPPRSFAARFCTDADMDERLVGLARAI